MPDETITTTVLRTSEELRRWLDDNTWFEDGEIVALDPEPACVQDRPTTVRLLVQEQVSGTYVAGTRRTIRQFALTARDVVSSTLDRSLNFVEGNCFVSLDVLDASSGVAFELCVPGRLEVRCRELDVQALAIGTETVRPWLSDWEIAAIVSDMSVPACETWTRWFQEQGVTVCWRIYGERSPGLPPDALDYEGWFLAQPERLSTGDGGVFFFACNDRRGFLSLQLQHRGGNEDDIVWEAAKRILATFASARIHCGNCEFSAAEWRTYLEAGSLPDILKGGGGR